MILEVPEQVYEPLVGDDAVVEHRLQLIEILHLLLGDLKNLELGRLDLFVLVVLEHRSVLLELFEELPVHVILLLAKRLLELALHPLRGLLDTSDLAAQTFNLDDVLSVFVQVLLGPLLEDLLLLPELRDDDLVLKAFVPQAAELLAQLLDRLFLLAERLVEVKLVFFQAQNLHLE